MTTVPVVYVAGIEYISRCSQDQYRPHTFYVGYSWNFSVKSKYFVTTFTCKRINLDIFPYAKINFKWIINLNVGAKAIKLLEEIIGGKLHDLRLGKDFLDMILKVKTTKEKNG